jgi:hypothetical protein
MASVKIPPKIPAAMISTRFVGLGDNGKMAHQYFYIRRHFTVLHFSLLSP